MCDLGLGRRKHEQTITEKTRVVWDRHKTFSLGRGKMMRIFATHFACTYLRDGQWWLSSMFLQMFFDWKKKRHHRNDDYRCFSFFIFREEKIFASSSIFIIASHERLFFDLFLRISSHYGTIFTRPPFVRLRTPRNCIFLGGAIFVVSETCVSNDDVVRGSSFAAGIYLVDVTLMT